MNGNASTGCLTLPTAKERGGPGCAAGLSQADAVVTGYGIASWFEDPEQPPASAVFEPVCLVRAMKALSLDREKPG